MNIKANDDCLYRGTKKPCKVVHIMGSNAWVHSSHDDNQGHIVALEHLEAMPHGGRVENSNIITNSKLCFSSEKAANDYTKYLLLENEMILYIKKAWEKECLVLDWNSSEGKYSVVEEYGKIYGTYTINRYGFLTLPTLESSMLFRTVFNDEDILTVLRRPQ
jgi:hypothetical protein